MSGFGAFPKLFDFKYYFVNIQVNSI